MRSVLFAFFFAIACNVSNAAVWINELHYDNVLVDVGEFVEVAYTPDENITDYSLVLYDGEGGVEYDRVSLDDGVMADDVMLTVYEFLTIQNGSPDGMALVDSSDNVIQFISYGGMMTANDGPAAGMNSTDIGVEESGATPVGSSLQLNGTGCVYTDFMWIGPIEETPEEVNTGQSFVCSAAPSLAPSMAPTGQPSASPTPVPCPCGRFRILCRILNFGACRGYF